MWGVGPNYLQCMSLVAGCPDLRQLQLLSKFRPCRLTLSCASIRSTLCSLRARRGCEHLHADHEMPSSTAALSESNFFDGRVCVFDLTRPMSRLRLLTVSETTFNYLAVMASSFMIGYWVGLGRSLGYTRGNSHPTSNDDEDEGQMLLICR